jgi:uncharacterized linocin/CFP29 family protein
MGDLLKRRHAPITSEAWEQIDDEARRVLALHLGARKVVDFSGPHGWTLGGINTGRLQPITQRPAEEVPCMLRKVQPLVEVRSPFAMKILELDVASRGANDLDLQPVITAAERVALAEDRSVFHGFKEAGITGIIEASPHAPIHVTATVDWPRAVVQAKETLRVAGMNGPYALALGPKAYDEVTSGSEDGYPLRKRIETYLSAPLVWAPALGSGGVLLTTRGGDYEITVGQDLAIGYAVHDRESVELYLTESFTFRILEEKAAIALQRD